MSTFVFRLNAPHPTVALYMSDEEREIMARYAVHWRPWIKWGQMVIFGSVLDSTGSWGLGMVEGDDEEKVAGIRHRRSGGDDRHRHHRSREDAGWLCAAAAGPLAGRSGPARPAPD
jgi:hypothetical protein